jgi:rubrerythrin
MDAIDISLKMETDAVKFYTEAAERTSHVVGKRMFLSIAEDEKRHIDMLNALIKGMEITHRDINPMDKIRTVFEELKDRMVERVQATTTETEALETAMKMEKEGLEFYRKNAAEAPDPRSRELFEKLIKEEEKHYEIFSNTLDFLTDTGNWFMWEEHSMVDGGTPWA